MKKPVVYMDTYDPSFFFIRNENEGFLIHRNPMRRPKENEEPWPIDSIQKVEGKDEVDRMLYSLLNPVEVYGDGCNPDPAVPTTDQAQIKEMERLISRYGENYEAK